MKRARNKAIEEARGEIERLYGDLESRALERQCQARTMCCRFQLTGRTPMLTRGEALYAAIGVRAAGRTKLPEREDGACPLLDSRGRCTIYAHRPFGCRTHFCEPAGGMYPRRHVADLIQRLEALDERLDGCGPRALGAAVADALSALE